MTEAKHKIPQYLIHFPIQNFNQIPHRYKLFRILGVNWLRSLMRIMLKKLC